MEATCWESRQIARLAPPSQALKAEGFAANRVTAIGGELGKRRIIHFPSQSFPHSAHHELSCVVISFLNESGREQGGFLRPHEFYKLKLPAELVELSSCRTGRGKEIEGERLMSLTPGFLYAGGQVLQTSVRPEAADGGGGFASRAVGDVARQGARRNLLLRRLRAAR